jgi:hypothetical protein
MHNCQQHKSDSTRTLSFDPTTQMLSFLEIHFWIINLLYLNTALTAEDV